jgi:hypothetical protein
MTKPHIIHNNLIQNITLRNAVLLPSGGIHPRTKKSPLHGQELNLESQPGSIG